MQGAWRSLDWRLYEAPTIFETLALRNSRIQVKQIQGIMEEQVQETERVMPMAPVNLKHPRGCN